MCFLSTTFPNAPAHPPPPPILFDQSLNNCFPHLNRTVSRWPSGLTRAHDREALGKCMVSKWGREVRIY